MRGQSRNWLAFPDREIEEKHAERAGDEDKGRIQGDFTENKFYDVNVPYDPFPLWDLRLPVNTHIAVTHRDVWASKVTIQNRFVRIEVVVHSLVHGSAQPTVVAESAFQPYADSNGAFKQYRCVVICTATFSRWRYGFARMRHYEQWVNDLFALLQRRFAWASVPLVDSTEAIRQYEKRTKQKQE